MKIPVDNGRVHFPDWYDEGVEWEAESKGYLPEVQVELPDGNFFPIFFYDPVRLGQDAENQVVLAEPAMVVIPEVTRAAILAAVPELIRQGFFDHLRPLPAATNRVAG